MATATPYTGEPWNGLTADLAWATGLFEGEGCITLGRQRSGTYPRLVVAMIEEDTVRRFHRIVGCGTVHSQHSPSIQAVGGKKRWTWRCCSREAAYVLGLMWPWLGERRCQRAIEVLDTPIKELA